MKDEQNENKNGFFLWFEKKFFGLLEECKKEYQDFEKQIEYSNRKYQYECPECGKLMRFESSVTTIRCDKCDHVFDPRLLAELDWKILDVNDLSDCPDILVGDYDFRWRNGFPSGGYSIMTVHRKDADLKTILTFLAKENIEYRPTPSKKTHEELAEEMRKAFSAEGEYTDEQRSFVKSVTTTHDYPENIASAQGFFIGFIAGRKSMELDS